MPRKPGNHSGRHRWRVRWISRPVSDGGTRAGRIVGGRGPPAYQRVMNALIGNRPLPSYYDQRTSNQNSPNDAANLLLLTLWADPALVPITLN